MMNLFKLYGKLMDALPLLGAVGSLLAVGAAILGRAAACHGVVCLGSALQPTALEMAAASAAVGLLKAHFNHQANADAIQAQAQAAPKA